MRGIKSFCESGGANTGEEVLYLPTIVESAVASPLAATAACSQIRKFLSKEYYDRPAIQYNAVMLIRILADNPGPSFTKNMDKQFADTAKHLLRNRPDPSVSQILQETLDALDRDKAYDTNLTSLFAMWRKEKGLMANAAKQFGPRMINAPPWNGAQQQNYQNSGRSSSRTLPPPVELSGRIEEARTSAKLLLQLVQSTPPNELLGNDLVKEFSERCISAQRSIQGYINCDNPPPDDDTMLTLIETNEQLSLAASKHQRAVLQARRLQGGSPAPAHGAHSNSHTPVPAPTSAYPPPPQPPRPEAPQLPPLSIAGQEQTPPPQPPRPEVGQKNDLPLPPALQAGGSNNREPMIRTVQEDDNPFADHHSSAYAPPPGPPRSGVPEGNEEHTNGYGQGQGPPVGNYKSTPSYLGRQESSANNVTMHGASPVSTGAGQTPREQSASAAPDRPENRRESDVSPIADASPVTYRY